MSLQYLQRCFMLNNLVAFVQYKLCAHLIIFPFKMTADMSHSAHIMDGHVYTCVTMLVANVRYAKGDRRF